jgi:hypothetical protein
MQSAPQVPLRAATTEAGLARPAAVLAGSAADSRAVPSGIITSSG